MEDTVRGECVYPHEEIRDTGKCLDYGGARETRVDSRCISISYCCCRLNRVRPSIFVILFISISLLHKSALCSNPNAVQFRNSSLLPPHESANSTGATKQNVAKQNFKATNSLDDFDKALKFVRESYGSIMSESQEQTQNQIDDCLRDHKFDQLLKIGLREILIVLMKSMNDHAKSSSSKIDTLNRTIFSLSRLKRDLFNDLDLPRGDDERGDVGGQNSQDDLDGSTLEREVTQAPITNQSPMPAPPQLIQSIYPDSNIPKVTHLNMTDARKQTAIEGSSEELADDVIQPKTGRPYRRRVSSTNRSATSSQMQAPTTEQAPYSNADAVLESPMVSPNGLTEETLRELKRLQSNDTQTSKSRLHKNHVNSRVPSPASTILSDEADLQKFYNQKYSNNENANDDSQNSDNHYVTIENTIQDSGNNSRLLNGEQVTNSNVPQVGDASVLLEHFKDNDQTKGAPKMDKHITLDDLDLQTNHLHTNPPYTAVGSNVVQPGEDSPQHQQQMRRSIRNNDQQQQSYLPWQASYQLGQHQQHNRFLPIPQQTFPFVKPVRGPKNRHLLQTSPVPDYNSHNVRSNSKRSEETRIPRATNPFAVSSQAIASHKELLIPKFATKRPKTATLEDRQQLSNDGVMSLIGQLVQQKQQQRGSIAATTGDHDQIGSQDIAQNDHQYSMINPQVANIPTSQILGMVRGGPSLSATNMQPQMGLQTALVRRRGSPTPVAASMNLGVPTPGSANGNFRLLPTMALPYVLPSYSPQSGTSTKYMPMRQPIQRNMHTQYQHRTGRVANSGAGSNYEDSQGAQASVQHTTSTSDPMWSDTQNQEDEYQQSPQTIQITAVPNGLGGFNGFNGVGNAFNGLGGWGGWNGLPWAGAGPWGGRQVLLVNKQPTAGGVGSEWRSWMLPVAIILSLPLILGALFVPVFLKSVMFLIQILQMLGLLMPPSQIASHFHLGSHSPSSG